MFIVVPTESVLDLCLKRFFDNQPGCQFHKLALGVVNAQTSVDKLIQVSRVRSDPGSLVVMEVHLLLWVSSQAEPVEESPQRMHLLQIPSNFRTSPKSSAHGSPV